LCSENSLRCSPPTLTSAQTPSSSMGEPRHGGYFTPSLFVVVLRDAELVRLKYDGVRALLIFRMFHTLRLLFFSKSAQFA
jgi:hypothetical protein